jgi:hypothetical protein
MSLAAENNLFDSVDAIGAEWYLSTRGINNEYFEEFNGFFQNEYESPS